MSIAFVAFFTIVLVTGMICTGNKMAITRRDYGETENR